MREARLAQVEGRQSSDGIPPSRVVCPTQEPRHKRKRGSPYEAAGVPPAKEKKRLSVQVASLTSEIEQLKAYLHSLAPPKPVHSAALSSTPPDVMGDELEDPYYHDVDMLSTQASNRDFPEHEETPRSEISDLPSATLEPSSVNAKDGSGSSRQGSEQSDPGQSPSSLCTILRTALARVGLDDAQVTTPAANPFFRRLPPTTPFSVPPSPHFLRELQMCWADPRAFAHHSRDSRLLSTMPERALESRQQVNQNPPRWDSWQRGAAQTVVRRNRRRPEGRDPHRSLQALPPARRSPTTQTTARARPQPEPRQAMLPPAQPPRGPGFKQRPPKPKIKWGSRK
ncbi:hypothetical protein SKAU_G00079680 [Synaphobranchus kaupii]|uniref:Uncharacterized protein n=1 Tax=Synaphobranchus kaupii TaxID=118154 RepID=A0A9Q1FUJ1_SYNKA|nr:hypothetical protein SKAU_G00079680 [Synaphobranchus kaupii]